MATDGDISLPSINPSRVKQRQAEEMAEFRKKSERLLSSIPKKHRVERARALEELSSEEEKLLARLAAELEELGIASTDDGGGASNSSVFIEETHDSKNMEPRTESKAARRRRRKAEKDAEAQRRIAEEKANMGPTPKQLELKAIEAQLSSQNLRIHSIPADGHCLYSAIAHQLETTNFLSEIPASVEGLREATSNYLMEHKKEYAPFIDEVGGDEEKLARYCEQIRNEPVWGGQVELRAMAEHLGVAIEVYAADMPVITMGTNSDESTVFRVSFHQKYYGLGEHYNSVVPQSKT
ncbi:OTU-like cysteine protease [Gracilaria domingensis]|nr:OTU-like cysteine protease [Gracilaria domingensis]